MNITVAKSAGFCFGVKRAVDTTYQLLSQPAQGTICILGHLIHNPHILRDLAEKGARTIAETEIDSLAAGATKENPVTVVIRAHGITKNIFDNLLIIKNIRNTANVIITLQIPLASPETTPAFTLASCPTM